MTDQTSYIFQKLNQRFHILNKIKKALISEGKKNILLTTEEINSLQLRYESELIQHLPKTIMHLLPVLFYINDQQHVTHSLDLYESENGWLEAIIPITPSVITAILVGQLATYIRLGQQFLITNQTEADGQIHLLLNEKDYYVEPAEKRDDTSTYQLNTGTMIVFNNSLHYSGEWLFCFQIKQL